MAERRAVIFLYTDAAQIDARTKKAMTAAGFLPVKVAHLDAVKIIDLPLELPDAELAEVTRAALQVIRDYTGGTGPRAEFAALLADRLIKASDKATAARDAARRELGDG